jgi:hypothetical protein
VRLQELVDMVRRAHGVIGKLRRENESLGRAIGDMRETISRCDPVVTSAHPQPLLPTTEVSVPARRLADNSAWWGGINLKTTSSQIGLVII